ncbi:hypothetical protein C2G38_2034417 [Gigaspora rosea]|uniref:Protein kinase domain-containing protein n=1 Tax=Gigaspora rosea TaxID=44941 RepID=A0A397VNF1_9GLOM|nr:hypothetical protein C2G38_2034417 [Gigaspora rosea]
MNAHELNVTEKKRVINCPHIVLIAYLNEKYTYELSTPFTVKANVGWSDCSFNAIDAPITALPRTRSTTRKPYTQTADIYAFGILFNVIASGKPPFNANQYSQEVLIEKVVYEHYRPDIPEHVPNFIKEIINNCWKHEPQERPKADYLNEVLYRYWLDFYEKKDNEMTRECKKSDDKAKVLADSIK